VVESARTLRFDDVEVDVPTGTRITLTVAGEEGDPVDLTGFAAALVASGLERPAPAGTGAAVFGEIVADDALTARVGGRELPAEKLLEAVSAGFVNVLCHALDRLEDDVTGADSAGRGPR
jgi:hypothetical protein